LDGPDQAFQSAYFSQVWRVRLLVESRKQPMAGKKDFPEPSSWNDWPSSKKFSFSGASRSFKDKK
jgi:hypothetical protein